MAEISPLPLLPEETPRPAGPLNLPGTPSAGQITNLPRSSSPDPEESPIGANDTMSVPGPHDRKRLKMKSEITHLVAIDAMDFERYTRGHCYPERYYEPNEPTIDPFTLSFEGNTLPEHWKAFTHPEGTQYFYYDKRDEPVPVITDAWIFNDKKYPIVCHYMEKIFEYMRQKNISFRGKLPPRCTSPSHNRNGQDSPEFAPIALVLDMRLSGNMGYYFVSHPTQTLFWLDPYDFSIAVGEVHTDYTQTLIGLEMKRHYWTHNDFFPHLYELNERDIEEIDEMVGFAVGDSLTSLTGSTTIFTQQQLKKIEIIIRRYESRRCEGRRQNVGERRVLCRIMGDFYHERFLNLYGEEGPRLNNTQSIHYSLHRRKEYGFLSPDRQGEQVWYRRLLQGPFPWESRGEWSGDGGEIPIEADPPIEPEVKRMHTNSTLTNILSLAMFGGPGVHLRKLRDMTVDRKVSRNVLAKYMERMIEEWRDVTLYGTVLLGVNVSFLTIQSVDDAGRAGSQRTWSQRASYLSIMASIGTIVSSFVLVGRHRDVVDYNFMARRSNTRWGLESLALAYGMPFSLAIWSILSFFVSFAILWFGNTDYIVMAIIGFSLLVFAPFFFWAILAPYESQPYEFFASQAVYQIQSFGGQVARGSMNVLSSLTKRTTLHETAIPAGHVAAPLNADGTADGQSSLETAEMGLPPPHRGVASVSESTVVGRDDECDPPNPMMNAGEAELPELAQCDREWRPNTDQ